jgi:Family of unknown function (DUF6152)
MNRKLLPGVAIAIALSLTPLLVAQRRMPPLFAESPTTLTGAVVQVMAMNPQTLVVFDAGDPANEPMRWQAILPGQQVLHACFGWSKDSVKPGDNVLVTGHAARSGAPLITLLETDSEMVASSGQTLFSAARGTSLRNCVPAR